MVAITVFCSSTLSRDTIFSIFPVFFGQLHFMIEARLEGTDPKPHLVMETIGELPEVG